MGDNFRESFKYAFLQRHVIMEQKMLREDLNQ